MGSVVVTTPYLTVTLQSATLSGRYLVVMIGGTGSVATQRIIAPVKDVPTTEMWRSGQRKVSECPALPLLQLI